MNTLFFLFFFFPEETPLSFPHALRWMFVTLADT